MSEDALGRRIVRIGSAQARRAVDAVPTVVRESRHAIDALPDDVKVKVRQSVTRLAGVRNPKDLVGALEREVAWIFQVLVPVLAAHPLPIHSRRRAYTAVAASSGLAAAFAEADEVLVVFTDGVAAPSLPAAFSALAGALITEVWVAVSLRVHDIERAGRQVDTALLSEEVTAAMLGTDVFMVRQLAGRAAKRIARRLAKRSAQALVPGVGLAVGAGAAAPAVKALSGVAVDAHPEPA